MPRQIMLSFISSGARGTLEGSPSVSHWGTTERDSGWRGGPVFSVLFTVLGLGSFSSPSSSHGGLGLYSHLPPPSSVGRAMPSSAPLSGVGGGSGLFSALPLRRCQLYSKPPSLWGGGPGLPRSSSVTEGPGCLYPPSPWGSGHPCPPPFPGGGPGESQLISGGALHGARSLPGSPAALAALRKRDPSSAGGGLT